MSLVITSTTESQESLNHAASEDWRNAPVAAEQETPQAGSEELAETAAETETAEETENRPRKKGGFQKKIDRLINRTKSLEDELASERKSNEELRARLGNNTGTQQPGLAGKPERAKFASDEEWIDALTDWKIAQKKIEDEHNAQAEAQREVFDEYNRKVVEARAKYEDFDEVVGQNISIPQAVQLAIIEMENGPDVAYFLGDNPEICAELLEMTPFRAVREVSRIADKLAASTPGESLKEKQKASPPAPVRKVVGGSTASTIPLDKLPPREYIRVREQQIKDRRR